MVEEVNALLDARSQDIERFRHRAADLAHGLKTPLAALAADSQRLRDSGDIAIANEIDGAVDAMRRHVDRELARARLRGGGRLIGQVRTSLKPLVSSLIATLSRAAAASAIAYDNRVADGVELAFDRGDLAEVVGNLLENATFHATSLVRISATMSGVEKATITIEDDGPGIAPELRPIALERGVRLDERGAGAGLGLAIVQEVLEAYAWKLQLDRSELGGLKALCHESNSEERLIRPPEMTPRSQFRLQPKMRLPK